MANTESDKSPRPTAKFLHLFPPPQFSSKERALIVKTFIPHYLLVLGVFVTVEKTHKNTQINNIMSFHIRLNCSMWKRGSHKSDFPFSFPTTPLFFSSW